MKNETQKITYADAGVDTKEGDEVSKILYNASKKTWKNRKGKFGEVLLPKFDDFSGLRLFNASGLPEGTYLGINFDGVGTKMELAERIGNHTTIAYDLFAMVCDDAVIRGAEPFAIGSILDVNKLTEEHRIDVEQLAEGYINAAKAAGVAVVNGEVAELGNRIGGYGPFNYNWGAAVMWIAQENRLIKGDEVQPGDLLVALKEDGFRSNGLSLVRRIGQDVHGDNWHNQPLGNTTLGHYVLTPSKIYTKAVVDMFGGFDGEPRVDIHGMAHITGGGLSGKLRRALKPSGLGAIIDAPFDPPEIMTYFQEIGTAKETGRVTNHEAYQTWNMGHGMVIITPDATDTMLIAGDHGIQSKVIGKVTADKEIRIYNKGTDDIPTEYLSYKR